MVINETLKYVPAAATDSLLHVKDTDRTERIAFPFTRYANILSAPNVVTDSDEIFGAPFHLLELETEELGIQEVRELAGFIV